MRSDLIGVVARFGTAKRLVFEEVDLKHLILLRGKLLITYDYLETPSIFLAYQCYVSFLAHF